LKLLITAALVVAASVALPAATPGPTAQPARAAKARTFNPVRTWEFLEFRTDGFEPAFLNGDIQDGGRLHELFDFGPLLIGDVEPVDGIATGEIFSIAAGRSTAHGDTFDPPASSRSCACSPDGEHRTARRRRGRRAVNP
jgi:hypothetical protein